MELVVLDYFILDAIPASRAELLQVHLLQIVRAQRSECRDLAELMRKEVSSVLAEAMLRSIGGLG